MTLKLHLHCIHYNINAAIRLLILDKKTHSLLSALLLFLSLNAFGQDFHYSQFHAAPLTVNPSLTGVYDGDARYTGNFRSQWSAVPVSYTTFSLGYDQKLNTARAKGWSVGAIFNYDQAGDSRLSLLQLGLSAGYQQPIGKRQTLMLGAMLGAGQRRFKLGDLTFDEQFIGGTFIANAPISEDFTNTSFVFLDAAVGVGWQVRLSERMQFTLGASAWHINRPRFGFLDEDLRQTIKYGINLDAVIQLTEVLDVMPSAIYFNQGSYNERIFGAYWRYHLDQRRAKEKAVLFGTWYRLNDAAIVAIAMEYMNWRFGLSYDVNASPFADATRFRGGIEFSGQYILKKVKILEKKQVCPIF